MKGAPRVLVIDPDDATRPLIREALAASGRVGEVESLAAYAGAATVVDKRAAALVVLNLDGDRETALALLRQIAATNCRTAVLPAGTGRDGASILAAMRAGAREFLMLPPDRTELDAMLGRLLAPQAEPAPQVRRGPGMIAIAGAVGGVGCSTLAVNLAVSLAKSPENSVLLADFDLLFGSADVMLDMLPDFTLHEATQRIDRVDEALLRRALARHGTGVHVLPRPNDLEDAAKIDPEALRRLLQVARGTFSSVVVDTSKALHSSDFVAFEMADVILVVVQLDLIGLRNAVRLVKLLRQFDDLSERIRIVVNRGGSLDGEIGIKKAEETLGATISYYLPNGKRLVHDARAKGQPIAVEGTGSKIHQAILDIAHDLRPFPSSDEKPRRGFFAALF